MKKIFLVFLSLLVTLLYNQANMYALNQNPNHHKPVIALALGGGGIKGAAHIGVLRVLAQNGIKIDYIAGCSMGSIVGGLYSAGIPLDKIEEILVKKELQKKYAPGFLTPRVLLTPLTSLKILGSHRHYAGLFNSKKFEAYLNTLLPDNKKTIESLDIPFCAVVTNLLDGKAYKLTVGSLAKAIVASSALPPFVRPVEINKCLYVDGAVRSNVPTVSARQYNPDILIAVCVDNYLEPMHKNSFHSMKNVAARVRDILVFVADEHHLQKADIIISPEVDEIPVLSKKTADVTKAIRAGEEATQQILPQIMALINNYNSKK